MSENAQIIENQKIIQILQQEHIPRENDTCNYSNVLPSDDQLDQFVENLCENLPSLNVVQEIQENGCLSTKNMEYNNGNGEFEMDNFNTNENVSINCGTTFHNSMDKNFVLNDKSASNALLLCHKTRENSSENKYFKNFSEKRPFLNSNLNTVIAQCSSSLELLMDKRKNLELLVQLQHNVSSINYNFSYTPRLPDTPSRVDRVMYDVNQERCRILGLLSALEKTIVSFSSKSTKDSLRKILNLYGKTIIDVIKERSNEAACSYDEKSSKNNTGVPKLIELITRVHRMNRSVHTALWCIEVKEQVALVMSKKQVRKVAQPQSPDQQSGSESQKTGTGAWMVQKTRQFSKTVLPQSKICPALMSSATHVQFRFPQNGQNKEKQVIQPLWLAQQETNIYQVIPQGWHHEQAQKKQNKTTQLYAQQERAEITQHFYSTLKQST